MTFVHHATKSSGESATPLVTEQPLNEMEARLQKLESWVGFVEPSELEQLLDIDNSVTGRLEAHNHRLSKLSDQLKALSQQVELGTSSAEVSNIRKQVIQLTKQVKRHEGWLTPDPVLLVLNRLSSDCPAFLNDLDRLSKQVDNHQWAIDWIRKQFNLVNR